MTSRAGGGCPGSSARRTVCREQAVVELERGWPEQDVEHLVDLRSSDGRVFMSIRRHPERGYRIWAPRHGRHLVSADGREIRSALPKRASLAWAAAVLCSHTPARGGAPRPRGVARERRRPGGRAIAFTASSGAGKSSLAAHLIAAGATFLTDDVLALELAGNGVVAHPGPARISVSSQELQSMSADGRKPLGQRTLVSRLVGAMNRSVPRMKLDPEKIEYEASAIIDYGDLADLTADHSHGHPGDPAFYGAHHEHLTFSNS